MMSKAVAEKPDFTRWAARLGVIGFLVGLAIILSNRSSPLPSAAAPLKSFALCLGKQGITMYGADR